VSAIRRIVAAGCIAAVALSVNARAQNAPAEKAAKPAYAEMTDGEVRKVDKEAGKITLRHGAIKDLDMPPMTMVFQVAEVGLLDKVKAGDKVRFTARDEGGGKMTLTGIEPAK
jgi:Cu(I)/Ag(I) efflux system periplasmic protein CusF